MPKEKASNSAPFTSNKQNDAKIGEAIAKPLRFVRLLDFRGAIVYQTAILAVEVLDLVYVPANDSESVSSTTNHIRNEPPVLPCEGRVN